METSYSIRARRPSMEVFQGVEFVALRMWRCNSYLHADEDGRSVYHGSLRGGGASLHNAVWAVEEVVAGVVPTRYVLLRGAYGRYLGSPDAPDRERECSCSFEAAQRDRDVLEIGAIMWRAIGCSGPDVPVARDSRGGVVLLHDKSGRYLRGNKSFLAGRRGISVDGDIDNETTLRWEVVRVPPSQGRPELPISIESNLAKNLVTACFPPLRRQIQFVTAGAGAAGNIHEFTGRSVQLVREKLAGILGYDDFTLCVRAGLHGRFTPLLINLPRSQETLHIVLVRPNTAANDQLTFPNLNELLLVASVTSHTPRGRGHVVSASDDLRLPMITPRPNETSTPLTASVTAATANKEDTIWERIQMSLSIALLTPLALLFSLRPLIPAALDRYVLMAFATVWGFGSLAFQLGLFGANSCERSFSRFVSRFCFIGFTLFVLYTIYLEMMAVPSLAPPPSPPADTKVLPHNDASWTSAYWWLCGIIVAGHLYSWVTACLTGSDKDLEP